MTNDETLFRFVGGVAGVGAVDVDRRPRTGRRHYTRRSRAADRQTSKRRTLLRRRLPTHHRHHQRPGRRQGRRQVLQAGAQALRQPVRHQPSGAPVHPVGDLRQGQLPAWPLRQQFRARHQLGRRKVSDSDGAGRRRLRPDLHARLQVHLRQPAAGRGLLRQYHRHARQARSEAGDRGAGRGGRQLRRFGRPGHASAPEGCGDRSHR